MKWHVLKTDPKPFAAVKTGVKTCEVRKNDRWFEVGDILVLVETAHTAEEMAQCDAILRLTGDACLVRVTHVLLGYGLPDGWCALSISPVEVS